MAENKEQIVDIALLSEWQAKIFHIADLARDLCDELSIKEAEHVK